MNDEELAQLAAEILGDCSAAAQALKELQRRRKSGKQAEIKLSGCTWLVFNPSKCGYQSGVLTQ